MAVNSNDSEFSLGLQTNFATPATLFHTALSTESGGAPDREQRETVREHPGPAPRATRHRSKMRYTGFTVPFRNTCFLRPRFFPRLLQLMGCVITTANNTTHYTHTAKIQTTALNPWMTALHKWVGDTTRTRRWSKARGESLQIAADAQSGDITCTTDGRALLEDPAAGTETLTAEIDVPLSPFTGALTLIVNGVTTTTPARTETLTITQTLDRENKVLHTPVRSDLRRTEIDFSGAVVLDALDTNAFEWYDEIFNGDTLGTTTTLDSAVGSVSYSYQSEELITGAVVPYSVSFSFPSVGFSSMDVPNSSGVDILRPTVNWYMIDNVTDPVVITIINDQASYAAS